MIKQFILLSGMGIAALLPVQATDLASALQAKKVCEREDGLIQATQNCEKEVAELVARVNAKRLKIYSDIAAQDGGQSSLNAGTVGAEMAQQEKATNPNKFCR